VKNEERAWGAGFFDAEGTTFPAGGKDHPTLGIRLAQKADPIPGRAAIPLRVPRRPDRPPAVLVWLKHISGNHSIIRGPYHHPHPDHPATVEWIYQLSGVNAATVLDLIGPYLGPVKRRQAEAVICVLRASYATTWRKTPPRPGTLAALFAAGWTLPPAAPRTVATERAWAAGFFDGDGMIRLKDNDVRVSPHTGQPYTRYTISLSISQNDDWESLKRFKAATGGTGSIVGPFAHRRSTHSKGLTSYYRSDGEAAMIDLRAILPHLHAVKYQDARSAVWGWIGGRLSQPPLPKGRVPITQKGRARYEQRPVVRRLRELLAMAESIEGFERGQAAMLAVKTLGRRER
jgi:hypothetical protein